MARILFDARLVLDRPTGIGQYVAALLPELARLADGHDLHVIRRRDPWPGYRLDTLAATHHVSRVRHMSLLQHGSVPALAMRLGADLLHYPHFDAPIGPGIRRLVATVHDVKYLAHPEFFPRFGAAKRLYMRRLYALTLRRAAVITHSRASATDLRRIFPREATRIDVVPAASDDRLVRAEDGDVRAFRSAHGLARPFVLSVGEFRPHKNHDRLIRAWARSRSGSTHDLVFVGQRRPDGIDPCAEAKSAGMADRVHVLENLSHEDLAVAYTAADLFTMVSLYEGFGLPILEAMACGTPVVASSTTSTGEVGGDAAVLVDPTRLEEISAAIDRVLSSEEERARLREAGLARAATYSWEATARGVLDVYDRSLRGTS